MFSGSASVWTSFLSSWLVMRGLVCGDVLSLSITSWSLLQRIKVPWFSLSSFSAFLLAILQVLEL